MKESWRANYLFNDTPMSHFMLASVVRVGEYMICTPCISQGVVYEQGQNPRFTPTFLQGALVHIEQRFIPQIHLPSRIPSHELARHSQLIKNTT